MDIRLSTPADLPRLLEIFAAARQFMAQTGNPNQWAADYPGEARLLDDMTHADSYVCIEKGRIIATFVLRGGIDPTYNIIENGAWKNNLPYATIHRIASSGEAHGIFKAVMHFASQLYDNIRIDTHQDNKVMQQAIHQAGFEYCGIIRCWNGSERLAFQWQKPTIPQ